MAVCYYWASVSNTQGANPWAWKRLLIFELIVYKGRNFSSLRLIFMFYSKLKFGVFQVVSNHRTITDCFVVFAELLQFERAITVQVSQVYGILQCTNTWLLPASSLCIAQCRKCSFLMYRNWGSPRNELQQGEHCPLHYIHNLHFQHLTHSIVRSSGDPTAVLPTSEGGYLYQP